jgi:glycosyltransferase involved in cell wall biosynthesis
MPNIAAIVPAFNEEKTIASVVKPLVDSKLFSEVIVISDGSTDDTTNAARQAGATLVHDLPKRGGKSAALQHGMAHTDAEYVAFFDADLVGFRAEHAKAIVEPVLAGKLAMCVGWRDRNAFSNFTQRFLPLIGGERAMRRDIFENIPERFIHGFMIEAATNYYCRANGLPYGAVLLNGLTVRTKYQKVGWAKALPQYAHMYYQVVRAMILVRSHTSDFKEHFVHEKHHDK